MTSLFGRVSLVFVTLLLMSFGSSNTQAQSDFVGFYGQLGTGYGKETAKSSSPSITTIKYGSATGDATSNTSWGYAPVVIGVGYTFQVLPNWTVGLGGDYALNTPDSPNTTTDFHGKLATGQVSYKYTAGDRYNLYLTPGYSIDKDKLAYLKLGYSSEVIQIQGVNIAGATNNSRINGYILGLGYKQIISGGFYGFGEANYMGYQSSTLSTPPPNPASGAHFNIIQNVSAYNILVGLGYKF